MVSATTPDLRSWLRAIGTLTAAVNGGQDLKGLLDLVAATAQELLQLDFCGVMLPAADGASMTIAGASGLPAEYIARVNLTHRVTLEQDATAGAPASRAFRSRRPCSVTDIDAEPNADWTDVAREQGYRSILAVPLTTATVVLGTLNSYRRRPHEFSAQEVEQLALLAEHATIALTSARILDDLREQHRLIVRSEEIHDRLTRVALRSGGVAGIAEALHELQSCPVVVRDANGEILATAGPQLDVALPAATAGSRPGHGLVRAEGPHVVADVVLDGAVVAGVWLLDQTGRLDPLGVRAAEHASVVLSLELLRQRTAAEVEQKLRGELLADLLNGADPAAPQLRERARLMGHQLSVDCDLLVARARPGPGDTARGPEEIAARAAAEAVRRTARLHPRPLVAAVRDLVVALWPTSIEDPAGDAVLRRSVAAAHPGTTAIIATASAQPAGIAAAYRIARGALALAPANGPETLVSLADLGAAGLLLQFADPAELSRYVDRTLGPVLRYDTEHGSGLLATLRAYLDEDLDRRATASRLVLHPNTVSQRLRRIETLTGLHLRSPTAVMDARTALMLLEVTDAMHESGHGVSG